MDLPAQFGAEPDDFRGLSLCAGYAGLDLGLHIAEPRYRTVCFVEREAHAAAALVARMADQALGQAPVWGDLRSFDGRPWRRRVHLITAGYPCQPFSYAGKRGGAGDPRHLWPEVARIIDEVEPEWVFCENVEGHLTLGFADVARDLRALGFTPKAGLFTAREQALAIAGAGSSSWPTPTASDAGYVPELELVNGTVAAVKPLDIPETSGGQFALNTACRAWTALWLGMKALGWNAAMAGRPSSLPVRLSFKHGRTSFLATLMPNPRFYELAMGWPIGWTEPEAPVTGFAAWLRRSRGLFSRLLSDFDRPAEAASKPAL